MGRTLRGITWNHTRGLLPLVAVSQQFEDLNPGVEITWYKRSLKDFGDFPIERLADAFDLLIIDHPFVGFAAAHDPLLPLENLLPADFLTSQAEASVGRSYESYWFDGHLWALPVDAAAPVSSWRPDLLENLNLEPPSSWEEVCDLARRGLVAIPATPVDSLMNFYMLCCGLGEPPFAARTRVVSEETGTAALQQLRDLVALCPPECLNSNPIAIYRNMVLSDSAAYCPFAFSYSNYSRPGFAPKLLRSGNLVNLPGGGKLRSTLGGTGLAISHGCRDVELAAAFARLVAEPASQRGIYFAAGGQPGNGSAWDDDEVNAASNDFFRNTRDTLEAAWLRPRFNGYIAFQDAASELVHQYMRGEREITATLEDLDSTWRSLPVPD